MTNSSAVSAVSPRPNLLFVRAGEKSLHRTLIAEDPERNWDCCVSWYAAPLDEHVAEYYLGGGQAFNKFEGFLEFWPRRPQPWPYRRVLLLDDDIYVRPGELSHFFQLCERYDTYLSQPALRWFTNTTLNILVRNPVCILRRVTHLEVMAPCFSTPALERLMHTFSWTKSTWGVDWAWGCLLEDEQPIYVVDAVSMDHTRSGDGRPTAFYRKLQAMGVEPAAELKRIREMFPQFRADRRFFQGNVYRPGVPRSLAPALMLLFERLKFIVRLRKMFLRNWRAWRARISDLSH